MGAQLPEAQNCKHQAKINLIATQKLMDPTNNFKELIKKQASEDTIRKWLCLANYSKNIIQQLNSEQLTSLQESLKKEAQL